MSVRKRTWKAANGETKEAWVVDYVDASGKRHLRTFDRKKDADDAHSNVRVAVQTGVHTSGKSTVAEAAENWIASAEAHKREFGTVKRYKEHARLHIVPRIGNVKLSALTAPMVAKFRDDLLASTSRAMAKRVLTSFKAILADAQERGHVAQNVATPIKIKSDKRADAKKKLVVGEDIPAPGEIRRILDAAANTSTKWRALLTLLPFSGLRSSEVRGLRWEDIDLKNGRLKISQRADAWRKIGAPKSAGSRRELPLPPLVTNTLRQWKLESGGNGLLFATGSGEPTSHAHLYRFVWGPAQVRAGVTAAGEPKYPGLHALRHFYASWCINPKSAGGRELPLKAVQALLGHSTLAMTADTYGHLFPSGDDGAELAAAERALMSAV
jgi:integrase